MTNNKSFIAGMVVANLLVLVGPAMGWDTINYGVSAIGMALLGTAILSSPEKQRLQRSEQDSSNPASNILGPEHHAGGIHRRDTLWRTLAAVIGFILGGAS